MKNSMKNSCIIRMSHILIKTTYEFGAGCNTTSSTSEEPMDIRRITEIKSFFCSCSELVLVCSGETTDGRKFVRCCIDDCNIYYEYNRSENGPLFVYFTTQYMNSEMYYEEILEIYTIFIVYQDEIVKICLIKECETPLEFVSCDVHRMSLFNDMSHLEIKNHMFALHPVITHGMKGLAVHTEHDGREVIEVIEFVFDLTNPAKFVDIRWEISIKMPHDFRSTDIYEDNFGLFYLTGSSRDGNEVSIIIHSGSDEYDKESLSDSHCILIYQKESTIVVVDDDNERTKVRLDTAQYNHVGALIVSCEIPEFFQKLKENHSYIPQWDESDEGLLTVD